LSRDRAALLGRAAAAAVARAVPALHTIKRPAGQAGARGAPCGGPRAGEGRAGGGAPWRAARLGVSGASGRWADGGPRRAAAGAGTGTGTGTGTGRASTGWAAAGAAEEEAAPGAEAAS
jgi:hypothetical protein